MSADVLTRYYGRLAYNTLSDYQDAIFQEVLTGKYAAALIGAELEPVITRGRNTMPGHIHTQVMQKFSWSIPVIESGRGGDVTLHLPGQLVVYPLIPLKPIGVDLHEYIRRLERACIDFLAKVGVPSRRVKGRTGVWYDESRKIVSIGIGVKKWITLHGAAININNDTARFQCITPCGLDKIHMISVSEIQQRQYDLTECFTCFARCFADQFNLSWQDNYG